MYHGAISRVIHFQAVFKLGAAKLTAELRAFEGVSRVWMWSTVADTQTDEVNALRKVQLYVPESPDAETVAYESEPEEPEETIAEPEEKPDDKGRGKKKALSPARSKGKAKK